MNPNQNQNVNVYKLNKHSTVVYNHFNDSIVQKIVESLSTFNILCAKITVQGEQYLSIIYDLEVPKNDFQNILRNSFSAILKQLRIQLVSVDFDDAIGILTTTDNKLKPLGLAMKNVPFLNTTIEGDFIARPKTLEECYEVMKLSHEKYEIVHAEFGKRVDNNPLVISIEKFDRYSIIAVKTASNVII